MTFSQTYRILCCTCTIKLDDVLMANARQLLYLFARAAINNIYFSLYNVIVWVRVVPKGTVVGD